MAVAADPRVLQLDTCEGYSDLKLQKNFGRCYETMHRLSIFLYLERLDLARALLPQLLLPEIQKKVVKDGNLVPEKLLG